MRSVLFLFFLVMLFLGGCGNTTIQNPPAEDKKASSIAKGLIGRHCRVEIKREFESTATSWGTPPNTSVQKGVITSVHGTLSEIDGEWLVLTNKGSQSDIYVPMKSVLLISAGQKPKPQ